MASPVRVRAIVHGSVQGVGFRWAAQREAARHAVAGTVRNLLDGTVEAEVEGSREGVDAMVAWLHEGPSSARVERVDVREVAAKGETGFRIA
ncbi:acylphosphatase [Agrococcus terreus]|uniref:acylphosphatase n=1 Tax=Agrococcus terreus TaxID=574649 RepID=A0ABQ2KGH2_9MICO|nr:acylphosphatase [Agrococcus terreus]GGN81095.1 acylphosphatase [Agrococcus terreus]